MNAVPGVSTRPVVNAEFVVDVGPVLLMQGRWRMQGQWRMQG
jgi:hypothetical protein